MSCESALFDYTARVSITLTADEWSEIRSALLDAYFANQEKDLPGCATRALELYRLVQGAAPNVADWEGV